MTPEDLTAIIARGEDSRHQFKRDFANSESLATELASFSNMSGGRLLIGVNDDGTIAGLAISDIDRRGNQFRVTIRRSEVQLGGVNEGVNEGVSGGVPALLELIRQKPGLRVPDLAQALNAPPKTIERWITQLRTDGLVEFIGPPKTGGYHAKVGAGGTAA